MTFLLTYWGLTVFLLLNLFAASKLFEKAGKNPSNAFIPGLNFKVGLEITGKPLWHMVLLLIPVVNFFAFIAMFVNFAKCFGKTKTLDHIFAMFLPPLFLYKLGKDENAHYLGKVNELKKVKKSFTREWSDAILFAVYAASIVRWATFEAFVIPTPSMEGSLLVGDYLFVSKLHYGARTPATPLQIPLTHQKIEFLNIQKTYLDWIQLPQFRIPGFSKIKRYDAVVFNVPKEPNNPVEHPVDLKTNYIKSCIGLPGNKLEVINKVIHIDGEPIENPEMAQYGYYVSLKDNANFKHLRRKYGLTSQSMLSIGTLQSEKNSQFYVTLNKEQIGMMDKDPVIDTVIELVAKSSDADMDIFPVGNTELTDNFDMIQKWSKDIFPWNKDFFGPIVVPAKGMTIDLTPANIVLYHSIIKNYEFNESVELDGKMLKINGTSVDKYTFKQNYYFMMGDNRHNSLDSRFWGFVPEDHVVGKAVFIWFSKGEDGIRWNRIFNLVD